jgi:hypothetical protein
MKFPDLLPEHSSRAVCNVMQKNKILLNRQNPVPINLSATMMLNKEPKK